MAVKLRDGENLGRSPDTPLHRVAPGILTISAGKPRNVVGPCHEREFFIDSLLVRIHSIIEMIWWTGLAPWEFEFPFPGPCEHS